MTNNQLAQLTDVLSIIKNSYNGEYNSFSLTISDIKRNAVYCDYDGDALATTIKSIVAESNELKMSEPFHNDILHRVTLADGTEMVTPTWTYQQLDDFISQLMDLTETA